MKPNTIDRLTQVFRVVFNDESLTIHPGTTAADIKDWDSMMHISLLVAVEKEFGIKFKTGEVHKLENVGDLLRTVESKLA